MKRFHVMDIFWGDCLKVKDEKWKSFEDTPKNNNIQNSCKVWVKRTNTRSENYALTKDQLSYSEQYAYFFEDGCQSLTPTYQKFTQWWSCRGEPLYDVVLWKGVEEPT